MFTESYQIRTHFVLIVKILEFKLVKKFSFGLYKIQSPIVILEKKRYKLFEKIVKTIFEEIINNKIKKNYNLKEKES